MLIEQADAKMMAKGTRGQLNGSSSGGAELAPREKTEPTLVEAGRGGSG